MAQLKTGTISLKEDRFTRLRSINWWNQEKLTATRVLIIGAGALGNEVIKNLALLGVGHMVIVDMDRVETSNLSRSVLFRETDRNRPKAECAARSAKELFPELEVTPIIGNVLSDVGSGFFKWADVVVGALDNREARVFVNNRCAMVNRPWIDGGIDVLNGIVRGFAPPETACYECTMSKVDWDIIDQRRSCSLLARMAESTGNIPTTATTASVIGAIQAQEVVKLVHKIDVLLGRGFVFEGQYHNSYTVNYAVKPDCRQHEKPLPIKANPEFDSNTPLQKICDYASDYLGGFDALECRHEIVHLLTCPDCGQVRTILQPVEQITRTQTLCDSCKKEYIPSYFHTLGSGDELLKKTPRQLGLPRWDILWARYRDKYAGIELAGDNPFTGNNSTDEPGTG
ncbi:MAG: ThiF family adenylyltransferase [bacterium]|nr:ThiF family adenylyltransferase [bacterium]